MRSISVGVYFIRDSDTRQAVGIFWASTLEELCKLIDEIRDPNECEFMELGPGGIEFRGDQVPSVPAPDQPETAQQMSADLFTGACPADGLWDAIYDYDKVEKPVWTPLMPEGQEDSVHAQRPGMAPRFQGFLRNPDPDETIQ
jgi:hypothetical protein